MTSYDTEKIAAGSTAYHKIETLYERDPKNRKVDVGKFSLPIFEMLSEVVWDWTEKVDGTNVRVIFDGSNVRFAGRTDDAQMSIVLLDHLTAKLTVSALAGTFDGPAILYGEGCGAKIQGGGDYCDGYAFVLFDVMCGGVFLDRAAVEAVALALGTPVVPRVASLRPADAASFVRERPASVIAIRPRMMEGLVGRPPVELQDKCGRRVIAKIKVKDF